ncbi:MAG: hypothetical protein JXB88_23930 [Spirochaetales bacterium]|nr:hypothetical protein [Spirochaetales bacterium]
MVRKDLLFFFLMLLLISVPFAGAEMMTTVTISDYLILSRLVDDSYDPDDDNNMLGITNLLKTRLDIISTGNKNVKAQFQLDSIVVNHIDLLMEEYAGSLVLVDNNLMFNIPRAYVKVRFPGFRITLGKTRVSWGEGFMFNAGDVIFEGMSLDVDISQSVLRDETDILASTYIPLGRFSYIETVLMPFPGFREVMPGALVPEMQSISDVSAGGIIAGKVYGITCQAGYLYKGSPQSHRPFLAAHGHLLVDWYLAASCDIPCEDPDEEAVKEGFICSGGVYSMIGLEGDAGLNLRLETGLYPFGEWEEAEALPVKPYGIYIFPEIVYTPESNMSFQLRSLVSPVDLSGLLIAGMSWNMYQGFTIGFMATAMFGDENDSFGWDRDSDMAFVFTMEYIFGE